MLCRCQIVAGGHNLRHATRINSVGGCVGIRAVACRDRRTNDVLPENTFAFDFHVSTHTFLKVVELALAEAPKGVESKEAFLARLRSIAKGFPPSYIKKILAQMKRRIKCFVEADDFVPKFD